MASGRAHDLYAVLGVSRDASVEDIKKSYRRLARKYHPDVNPGNREAEERFKSVSFAHDVLSDPEKRRLYDEFGMEALQSGFDAKRARMFRGQGKMEDLFRGGEGGARGFGFERFSSFEDLFGDLFGGQRRRTRHAAEPGGDTESPLEIDFLDAVRGTTVTIALRRQETCGSCKGTGGTGTPVRCPDCGGRGQTRVGAGPFGVGRTCGRCGGAGRVPARVCSACQGRGVRETTEKLSVRIPPGVSDGSRVRVAGKGSPGRGGGRPGDHHLVISVRPHALLERRGNHLYLDLPITVGEAMLGAAVAVPTPDGDVNLRVPRGSQSGRRLRLRGRGVRDLHGAGRGDLYVRLLVQIPTDGGEKVRRAVDVLERSYAANPRKDLRL